jgi:hypothetical protein
MSLDSITSVGSQAANALHGCCVIIPALNPQSILLILVKNLQQHGFKHILLVDDGSSTEGFAMMV